MWLILVIFLGCATTPKEAKEIVVVEGTMTTTAKIGNLYCFKVQTATEDAVSGKGIVYLFCSNPPTERNEGTFKHFLGWVQLLGGSPFVVVSGVRAGRSEELIGGVDFTPIGIKLYDADRVAWIEIDLEYGDSVTREVGMLAIKQVIPQTIKQGVKLLK